MIDTHSLFEKDVPMKRMFASVIAVLAVSLVFSTGCTPKKEKDPVKSVVKKDHDHPDKGPHGGPLLEWGAEEYHVEYVFDRDKKQATVYILDVITETSSGAELPQKRRRSQLKK